MRAGSYYRGAKEESEAKGLPHQPGGAVCQGFAGENYARRASFSMGKRRSRLTLTGRRRQATFAGVFVFDDIYTTSIIGKFANLKNNLYFCH